MSFLTRTKGYLNQIKGFLISPIKTFNDVVDEEVRPALSYYGKLLIIYAILIMAVFSVISSAATDAINSTLDLLGIRSMIPYNFSSLATFDVSTGITLVIGVLLGGLLLILIGGAWTHIWISAVGGRNGIGETIKAMAYGSTPSLLFGWAAFFLVKFGLMAATIGLILFLIWFIAIAAIGVRQLHELETHRAILGCVLGTIIIPAIIVAILVFIRR
jgi:hypothetical protein